MITIDFENLPQDYIHSKFMRECEKKLLQWAYNESDGVILKTSELLGLNRKTLTIKLEYYGIHTVQPYKGKK